MASEILQCVVEEKETRVKCGSQKIINTPVITQNGKSVFLLQVCLSCNKEFPFKQGRTHCPRCNDVLRRKTVILKAP
jgi:hypothetical protein